MPSCVRAWRASGWLISPISKPAPFLERAKKEPIGSAEFLQSTDDELMPEPELSPVPAQPLKAAASVQAAASRAKRTQRAEVQGAELAVVMLDIMTARGEGQLI